MGVRGSDPFVEQVRMATEVLTVVGGYVELHKAGRRWKGLCPFHGEKTPSFFVNQESQTYYCFGCHQGGDVFRFVMEQEKLSFPEALKMLAEKAGIPMPRRGPKGAQENELDRVSEAMEVAAEFYRERLQSPDGAAARSYLERRGIEPETIARFGLGWAPASWDALLRHAGRLLPERALARAGLVIEGERGLYDRFRERIVVPIRTPGGRTVAFGARLLGPGEPKYLNSPETPLYKKGSVLFGLPEARDAIRSERNILVVEGYFDVIGLAQAGIGWAVGTCGTALTEEQSLLMRRYAENWTLLFDGDAAGRAAVLRAIDAALPVHPSVRVVLCPSGQDPDSWVRAEGAAAIRAALERSHTPLQVLEEWTREQGLRTESILVRVAELLRKVSDPMIRDLWIQEAAGRFKLRESAIAAAVGAAGQKTPAPRSQVRAVVSSGKSPSRLDALERQVVAAAVQSPGLAGALLESCRFLPEFSDISREILAWIDARSAEGIVDAAALLSRASEEAQELMRDLSFLHEESDPLEEVPRDLVRNLKKRVLERRKRDLTDRIRRAAEGGQDVKDLLLEQQKLATALRDLDAAEALPGGNFP